MAKYPRVGRLTIAGKEYPAAINARVLTDLEAKGISMDAVLSDDGRRWANLVILITLAIKTGARLSGCDAVDVTEDQIADSIDITELTDLAGQVATLISGDRTVEAEPPKN